MDSLVWIAVAMSAIVFTWLGYFLGNILPYFKKDEDSAGQYQSGISTVPEDVGPAKLVLNRIRDWLLERDKDFGHSGDALEEEEEPEVSDAELGGGNPQAAEGLAAPEAQERVAPISGGKGTIHVWQDRDSQQFFAEVDGLRLDLNQPLSPGHHNKLSFLLVDLQDKVGVSATIQAKIAENLKEALPEEEEKAGSRSSFNPVQSMLNYVRADVPKLEEAESSIPAKINAILQKMLLNTPLENRGISMGDWPGRGVVFMVGLDIYDDIHQIPDADIRQVIRNAVAAWEAEQKEE